MLKRKPQQAIPRLETMERLLDEVVEAYAPVEQLYLKLKGLRRGSEAQWDVLADLEDTVEGLRSKAEETKAESNDIIDTMPD